METLTAPAERAIFLAVCRRLRLTGPQLAAKKPLVIKDNELETGLRILETAIKEVNAVSKSPR